MSNQQLLALRKLPSQDWTDALDEIISTAPRGRVTLKHFKKIVERRIQSAEVADLPGELLALPLANKVENLNNNDGSSLYKNYELPPSIIELEKLEQNLELSSKDASSLTSPAIELGNIVTIQCTNNADEKQQYSGCWGVIQSLYQQSANICVCGEIVEYLLSDINPIENPTPTLMEVSDRTASLWQVLNLPASVGHLLATFYQRRLDFLQSDLDVLAAIESCIL